MTGYDKTPALLIASCGINCALCSGYQRKKNPCPGCKSIPADLNGKKHVETCRLKNCESLRGSKSGFCFECDSYPCRRLGELEKRYSAKYDTSVLVNLETIRDEGMETFLAWQEEKWTCPDCGLLLSMHRPGCIHCGYARKQATGQQICWK